MNKRPIEQAKNPLLRKVQPALDRAALLARKVALQTGTAIIIMQNGKKQRIPLGEAGESPVDYQTGHKQS